MAICGMLTQWVLAGTRALTNWSLECAQECRHVVRPPDCLTGAASIRGGRSEITRLHMPRGFARSPLRLSEPQIAQSRMWMPTFSARYGLDAAGLEWSIFAIRANNSVRHRRTVSRRCDSRTGVFDVG